MVLRALQFLNALVKGPFPPATEVKELKSTEVRAVHPVKAPLKQPVLVPRSELKSTEVREVQYWKALRN